MTIDPKNPPVGIHEGVPFADYKSWKAVNASMLKPLLISAIQLQNYLTIPREPSDGMKVGSALDAALLEPDTLDNNFVAGGECKALKKDGVPCGHPGLKLIHGAWACGIHSKGQEHTDSRTVLTSEQWQMMRNMAQSVREHPKAAKILSQCKSTQTSLVWRDPETGLLCKARPDIPLPIRGEIWDLKNTCCQNSKEFLRDAFSMGYFLQLAHYIDGANVLSMKSPAGDPITGGGFIVAMQGKPPARCDCIVCDVHPELLAVGLDQRNTAIRAYAALPEDMRLWRGISDDYVTLRMENWMKKQTPETF